MRHSLVLIGAALALQTGSSFASEWWYVTESDKTVHFADRDSVQSVKVSGRDAVRVWAFFRNASADKSGELTSREMRYYDCVDNSSAIKSYISYNSIGDVLNSRTIPEYSIEWNPVAPGTVASGYLNFVCNAEKGEGDVTSFDVDENHFFFVNDVESSAKILVPKPKMTPSSKSKTKVVAKKSRR